MNGRSYLLFSHLLLLHFSIKSVQTLCNLPAPWRGQWYQRGMSSLLEITDEHIQTKGRCIDGLPLEQYYLFTDRINRCTRCLLFIERHLNLLQYRESECSDVDEIPNVQSCPNLIGPDAALYTLHRNHSQAQLCPIQAPYRLTHLIKDGSICQKALPSSFIGECANQQQFHLHLSPCSSYQQTLDLQLVCVGTWTEGFHTYFVTRIINHSRRDSSSQNQYACFHFLTKQNDGSGDLLLGMATDDSCRDLNSKSLSTVMTLSSRRHSEKQSNRSCLFPIEYHQTEWISLNRSYRLLITHSDMDLFDVDHQGYHQRHQCLDESSSSNYRIRSLNNCDVAQQCVRFLHRTSSVLEMIFYDCHNDQSIRSSWTFLRPNLVSNSCPRSIGSLYLQSMLNARVQRQINYQMSIGCDEKEKILITQQDRGDLDLISTIEIERCLASWQSDDGQIVSIIAQSISTNLSYCLIFQMNERILIRNHSSSCSSASPIIYSAKHLQMCSRSSHHLSNLILLVFFIVILR